MIRLVRHWEVVFSDLLEGPSCWCRMTIKPWVLEAVIQVGTCDTTARSQYEAVICTTTERPCSASALVLPTLPSAQGRTRGGGGNFVTNQKYVYCLWKFRYDDTCTQLAHVKFCHYTVSILCSYGTVFNFESAVGGHVMQSFLVSCNTLGEPQIHAYGISYRDGPDTP